MNTKEQYEAFQKELRETHPIAKMLADSSNDDFLPGGWKDLIYLAVLGLTKGEDNATEESVTEELVHATRNLPELQLAVIESPFLKSIIKSVFEKESK